MDMAGTTGKAGANFLRRIAAHGDDEIQRTRNSPVKFSPTFAARFKINIKDADLFQSIGVNPARWLAARAMNVEKILRLLPEQGLCHDTARGISGAENQQAEPAVCCGF